MKLNAIVPVILLKIETKFSQNNGDVIKRTSTAKTTSTKKKNTTKKTDNAKSSSSSSASNEHCDSNNNALEKVEKLQWHLMVSLNILIFL